jgi:hypothetical protein
VVNYKGTYDKYYYVFTPYSTFFVITQNNSPLNTCSNTVNLQASTMANGRRYSLLPTEIYKQYRRLPSQAGARRGTSNWRYGRPPAALTQPIRQAAHRQLQHLMLVLHAALQLLPLHPPAKP